MSFLGRLSSRWSMVRARIALWAGRPRAARAALKDLLSKNPNSFPARFLLGMVYLAENSPMKARRELDLAWQIDPERFEKAYLRLRARYEDAPDLFETADAEHVPVAARAPARRADDFVDDAERRRFSEMPPISRDEIPRIDWDRFEDEISRG